MHFFRIDENENVSWKENFLLKVQIHIFTMLVSKFSCLFITWLVSILPCSSPFKSISEMSSTRHLMRRQGSNKQFIMSTENDNKLIEELVKASIASPKLKFHGIFSALASSDYFIEEVWQKKPFLCSTPLENVAGSFLMTDVKANVDKDFLEAGRGTFTEGKGGWNMAAVSKVTFNQIHQDFQVYILCTATRENICGCKTKI